MYFLRKIWLGAVLIWLFSVQLFSQFDTACIGDRNVWYGLPSSGYNTIDIWTVEGESTGDVRFRQIDDTIIVDWLPWMTAGFYTITVQQYTVFFDSNHDSVLCAGAPFSDSVLVWGPTGLYIGNDQATCVGSSASFASNNSYPSYLWSTGSNSSSVTIETPGTVWLEVTDSTGCKVRDTALFSNFPQPEVNLGDDASLCDEEYILDAGSDGVYYTWYAGKREFSYAQSISITEEKLLLEDIDTISVILVDANGCSATDTIILAPCYLDMGRIPNVITPNGDGYNDTWRFRRIVSFGKYYPDLVVEVFDRWGKLVFRSPKGYPEPWDGKDLKGKPLPMGTYFYILNPNNGGDPVKGTVTIVR